MSVPDDNTSGAGGMLNGHGVGIALAAIFVGVGLAVAFVASDGAIFGLNLSSASDNGASLVDSDAGDAGVLSRDAFDEGSGEEESAQPAAESSAAGPQSERSSGLSEDERQLLAMSDFSWDSISAEYIASSQDRMDKFGQQNFTRQKPVQPGAEPLFLSDKISVDVDRDRDSNDGLSLADIIDIETPIDIPIVDDSEEHPPDTDDTSENDQEEEPQDDSDEGDSGGGGSGSNSTGTNSTDTQGPREDSDSGNDTNDGNSTSSDNSTSGGFDSPE